MRVTKEQKKVTHNRMCVLSLGQLSSVSSNPGQADRRAGGRGGLGGILGLDVSLGIPRMLKALTWTVLSNTAQREKGTKDVPKIQRVSQAATSRSRMWSR